MPHQQQSRTEYAVIPGSMTQVDDFRKPDGLATAGPGFPFVEFSADEAGEEEDEDDDDDDEEEEEEEESEDECPSQEQNDIEEEEEETEEEEDEVDESVAEDMRKLEENFRGISKKYRLINRIGEGTFSTVYKAEQLPQRQQPGQDDVSFPQSDGCDAEGIDERDLVSNKRRKLSPYSQPAPRPPNMDGRRKPEYVALKKIYVTSSPFRIQNELEILHALRSSDHICPLLTAFRHLDQVVAVLPYFRHIDFRLYYRDFVISDMRNYFHSLLSALHSVHAAGIIHRDIKPTNFLYDNYRRGGVLVDFGLAEKQGTDWQPCLCTEAREVRKERFLTSFAHTNQQASVSTLSTGYPKNDPRPTRRANRAGTRGFRAPEVLLKCTSQTTKIDIWSTGVILLTLLGRRFPFFNSTDDVDALIEISSIFGRRRMRACAAMHGSVLETNIDTIGDRGFSMERIVVWASCRDKDSTYHLSGAHRQAIAFLERLMDLDPQKRPSAKEALQDDFFLRPELDDSEELPWDEEEEKEKKEKEKEKRKRKQNEGNAKVDKDVGQECQE